MRRLPKAFAALGSRSSSRSEFADIRCCAAANGPTPGFKRQTLVVDNPYSWITYMQETRALGAIP